MPNWFDYAMSPGMAKGFHSFFNPDEAYEDAEKASREGWDQAQGYEKPYWQQGQDQYGRLNQAVGDLTSGDLLNKWSSNYETSPYAQRLLSQNKTSGLDAASSMGLMGSSAALGNIQTGAGDIVAKDRQQYLENMMKNYMAGIGLGQNIYGIGANMGANLGGQSMTQGQNIAGLEYGRSAAPGKLFGQVAGAAMNMAAPGSGNMFNPG